MAIAVWVRCDVKLSEHRYPNSSMRGPTFSLRNPPFERVDVRVVDIGQADTAFTDNYDSAS
jgi:hypothetical protein